MSMDKTLAKMRQDYEELAIAIRVFDRISGNGHHKQKLGAVERAMGMHISRNGNGADATLERQKPGTSSRGRKVPYEPRPGKELPQVELIPDLDLRQTSTYEGMKLILQRLKKPVGAREMAARLHAQGQMLKDPRGMAILMQSLTRRDPKMYKRLKGQKKGEMALYTYKGAGA